MEKEKQGGISRMWLEYFKLMPKSNINASFLVNPGLGNITKQYLNRVKYFGFPVINDKLYSRFKLAQMVSQVSLLRNIALPNMIPSNTKIFHSTGYINPIYNPKNIKIVTTIHDMVFWDQKNISKKELFTGIKYGVFIIH